MQNVEGGGLGDLVMCVIQVDTQGMVLQLLTLKSGAPSVPESHVFIASPFFSVIDNAGNSAS